ncbi:MFS transporter [Paenibacillus cremeus]|uniref:MFS transporter n=1 Tax=Paenibacillus cremeus TaxID=2163881 RepID=A0A559JVK6_9BACL|nr:MFS transporter [Paenibacillus cremeus]TVY03921.1 MFS transporter [Paenibacillus cremeus]
MVRHLMDTLSPLRNRNFRIYISGQGVSMLGNWMQGTAQAWVVWRLTGSTAALGIVAMLNTLPVLLLGPFSGVTADRLDRRRLLIYTNLLAMVLAVVLGTLVHTGAVRLWHVYVLAGILGCVNALDIPSQQAFLGDLSGVEQVRKGFTLNAIMEQVTRVIGPSAAGWMIGSFGEAPAFWLNGLSYIAVLTSLFLVKASQERQISSSNPLSDFRAGLAFVRRKPRIQELIAFTAMTTLFGFVNTQLFPEIADHLLHGGPETLGTMMGTFGAGSFFSALVLTPLLQQVKRTGWVLSAVIAWTGLWFGVFSFSTWLPFTLLAIFCAAFAQPVVLTTVKGLLQVLAPPNMRARVLSLQVMIAVGVQPLSSLTVGFVAQFAGSSHVIRTNGLLMILSAILILALRPALRVWSPQEEPLTEEPAAVEADPSRSLLQPNENEKSRLRVHS